MSEQDCKDGAALRRLREASPRPGTITIGLRAVSRKGMYPYYVGAGGRLYYGHTIAKACNACRTALK